MAEVKSKRASRGPAPGKNSHSQIAHSTAATAPVPETAVAADALAAPPAAMAEPVLEIAPPRAEPPPDSRNDAWQAAIAAQTALTRGAEEFTVALTGMTRSGMAAASDAALALLGARTLAEAVEINAGLAQRSSDAMIKGAVRLSEIGVKIATEASRHLWAQLDQPWSGAGLR